AELHLRRLAVTSGRNTRVDRCPGRHGRPAFGFGPGFCSAFTLRPFAISASVHAHSVRLATGIATDGRIFPSRSQRWRVIKETPIFFAACVVEYFFFVFIVRTYYD